MDFTKAKVHPDYIGAVLLIAVFIAEVYSNRFFLEELFNDFNLQTLEIFSTAILGIIGAAILLFTKHRDITKTLIVTATIFALLSLYDAILDLVELGELLDYDFVNFIEGVVKLTFAVLLISNIILFISRRSNSLTLIMYSLAGIFCLYIIRYLNLYRYGCDVPSVLKDVAIDAPLLLLILFCILLLLSDTIKTKTVIFNIKENFSGIRASSVPAGVKIDRAEIVRLEEFARNGMDCDRYVIPLNSFYKADYKVVLSKEDSGTVFSFSPLDDETGIGLMRAVMRCVTTDTGDAETCETVRIYGEDMFFIQLIAGCPYEPPEEKVPLTELIKSLFRKETAEDSGDQPEQVDA